WLNGRRIADSTQIVGAYRVHELDITDAVDRHGTNALAIEVFPPEQREPAITWVDWNPSVPDKNMGLWRDVWLRSSGPVALRSPYVITKLDGERARVTVAGDLVNATGERQIATVQGDLDGRRFIKRVELEPRASQRFEITPADCATLDLDTPR